jgi:HdeA/HdeB family protein
MTRQRSAPLHSKVTARDASGYCAEAAAIRGIRMRTGRKATIVIATVVYAGCASSSALAQGSKDRMIEQYTCKDIMRESGPSRDVAIAFLRGFLLGKTGSTKFNIDVLHKQSDEFIERCLANPDEKAMDAMSKIIG